MLVESALIRSGIEPAPPKPPAVFADVKNCWYHYYAYGTRQAVRQLEDVHFTLAEYKVTPDFYRLSYNFEVCHWQIGQAVTEGKSIIVVKTSIRTAATASGHEGTETYVVGFFRVSSISNGHILMDPKESLMLFSNPIRVDLNLARQLFSKKSKEYWENRNRTLAAKIGSLTRNKYLERSQADWIVGEIFRRYQNGAENYLGARYLEALRNRNKDTRLDKWLLPGS